MHEKKVPQKGRHFFSWLVSLERETEFIWNTKRELSQAIMKVGGLDFLWWLTDFTQITIHLNLFMGIDGFPFLSKVPSVGLGSCKFSILSLKDKLGGLFALTLVWTFYIFLSVPRKGHFCNRTFYVTGEIFWKCLHLKGQDGNLHLQIL